MLRLLALLLLIVLPFRWVAAAQDVWTGVERVVAVGDVHGDYNQFVKLLRDAGLINADSQWTGGKTHLVQVGDVPDRGPDTRRVLDLLMRLEKQANKAKGYVHALIGNHEAMNIYRDLRYVTDGEYEAFRDRRSERRRDAYYDSYVEYLKSNPPPEGLPAFDAAFRQRFDIENPLGKVEHGEAYGPRGKYGKWLRRHNAVVKINDTLFLHGGIGPKFAAGSIREINESIRAELNAFSSLEQTVMADAEGPLWYRGLALEDEGLLTPHVETVLSNYDCRRIVIGHTPTAGTVIPRFGGRVVMIDAGLSRYYGGRLACLVIEKGRAFTLHRGEKLELPQGSGVELVSYLKQAAALDPAPSPLESLISKLEAPAVATTVP